MEEKIKVAKDAVGKVVDRASDFKGSKKRKIGKGLIGGVIIVLLGALGLEFFDTDFDLGSLLSGESFEDSEIIRDEQGNLMKTDDGDFVTRIFRDRNGNEVADGTAGAKYTDEYNCDDFDNQSQAQQFFERAGGVSADTNRLDGDKDGEACESLPIK